MRTAVIRTFDNYFSANIILTRLQDAGINCFLADEYSATVYPVLSNSIGGIKLTVDADQASEANELLISFHKEHMSDAVCPRCGKNDFIEIPEKTTKNFFIALLTFLFSNYSISAKNIYQCRGCGYESRTLPENTVALN